MRKHGTWLLGILLGVAACKADHMQVGNDDTHPYDGGDQGDLVATPALGTGGSAPAPLGSGGAGGTGGAGGRSATGATSPAAHCGDGILQANEQCDDGNSQPFDGCNGLCQVEANFRCPLQGEPCQRTDACGNGVVESPEACDDGNTVPGDGCSADCQTVEAGWFCPILGQLCRPRCGDGVIVGSETCDDGNANGGDGCSSTCRIEPGASCGGAGVPCTWSTCGNGLLEQGETCDCGVDPTKLPSGCKGINGASFGDGSGCTATCVREPICLDSNGNPKPCSAVCGDGNISAGEDCDDGNLLNGDGCSAGCKLEMGYTCSTVTSPASTPCAGGGGPCPVQRSLCAPTCGDGVVVPGEECDDGARNDDTAYGGCTTRCTFGPGCGDGIVQRPEECDLGAGNGRPSGSGGCTLACTKAHFCGDGIADGSLGEECDLGLANGSPGSLCSSACTLNAR